MYGPYSFALPELGQGIGFDLAQEEFETIKGKKGRIFKVREHVNIPSGLPANAETMINGILDIWALEDTSVLLEYIYKTEPMRVAEKGKALDFSVVPRRSAWSEMIGNAVPPKLTMVLGEILIPHLPLR